jgi:ASC-1-like (ASCH) protein
MIHEAGRESSLFEDILAGTKTVEGRLARGKFLNFKPGDIVQLRKDMYEEGLLVASYHNQAKSKVVKVERYDDFEQMLHAVGYRHVIPRATSLEGALREFRRFYSEEDEAEYGVLAIHFELLPASD